MAITQTARPAEVSDMPRLGLVRRRFGRWIALGQYGFPFVLGRPKTAMQRLRALARRSRFGHANPLRRIPLIVAMTLLWPFGAFTTSLKTCRDARARGRNYGLRQLLDMYALALRHSIPPLEYALYHFDDPARRASMHRYVYWNDLPGLAALRRGADSRDVQDKDRFADICAAHGFAHVATLAVFERGRQIFPHGPFAPDQPVLWTKALRLKGGAGGACWTRDGAVYRDAQGRALTPQQLAAEFARTDCLVQPFVQNHPLITGVSNGALAALRIVTGMRQDGTAEFVTAQLCLPHGARQTSVAGVLCSLDPASGTILRAAMSDGTPVERHPNTGAQIAGITLPFWHESIALVLSAHAGAFAKFPFLGWDVALTPEGPVLLETNSGWGALFHQSMDGPLGDTAFPRLLEHWV